MKRFFYLFISVSLFCFSGCNKDDEDRELREAPADNKIKFELSFADNNTPKTKVFTDENFTSVWQNGDKIGIYIVKGSGGLLASGNYADNVEFTYNNGIWTTSTPQYYPNDGGDLAFYAYYPYDAGMSNPRAYTFNVPIDQASNNGENYQKKDFLWAKREHVAKSSNAVALQFSHALAMIEIVISDNVLSVPAVNLVEAVSNCTINLANQSITPGSTKKTIQMWLRRAVNFTFFYWALVPPQTMDIRFVWTKNNIPYTVTPASDVTLTSGNIEKYTTTQP